MEAEFNTIEWYTVEEVAKLKKVSPTNIAWQCERGMFPGAQKMGAERKWAIPRRAITRRKKAYA